MNDYEMSAVASKVRRRRASQRRKDRRIVTACLLFDAAV
jgi:hypothetical protein